MISSSARLFHLVFGCLGRSRLLQEIYKVRFGLLSVASVRFKLFQVVQLVLCQMRILQVVFGCHGSLCLLLLFCVFSII